MVPRHSAIFTGRNSETYDNIAIDADHSNIVKFNDEESVPYKILLSRLMKMEKNGEHVVQQRFKNLKRSRSSSCK